VTTHLTSPNKHLLNWETSDATLLTRGHDVLLRARKAGSKFSICLFSRAHSPSKQEGLRSQALNYAQSGWENHLTRQKMMHTTNWVL